MLTGSASNVVLLRSLHDKGWTFNPLSEASGVQDPTFGPAKISWNPLGQVSLNGYLTTSLIDAYFFHYHTVYPIVHEATFRAQYAGKDGTRNESTWSILFRTILAIGAWCIGCQLTGTQDEDLLSSHTIEGTVFECGNIPLVQALALLGTYWHKHNRPNTAWNYEGLAVRIAISLGLHKELPAWDISPLQRETRRRVWWSVYMFDSGASGTFGRPILLPTSDVVDTQLPLNISDEVPHPAIASYENANKETRY